MCRYSFNRFKRENPKWDDPEFAAFHDDVTAFHRLLPGYRPTPLVALPALARALGVKAIWVKDESYRMGLSAFKVLGASYAIYRFLKGEWESQREKPFNIGDILKAGADSPIASKYRFCTATDGNHGRAVAWTAKRLFQKSVIYMPKGTVPSRIQNIESEGARVEIIDGTYDDAVHKMAEDAAKNGWEVIADTAYPGYMTIPGWIMAGYLTMFTEMEPEIHPQAAPDVDVVFMQAGVGSFAAAGTWYYVNRYGADRPKLISVEPVEAACLLESIEKGTVTSSRGSFKTIMAGLNCGTLSLLAWPIIRDGMDMMMAISDRYAIQAMRRFYRPDGDDPHIISGESGAAGLGALLALVQDKNLHEAQEKLDIGPKSRILLFNTEGATDPAHFEKVIRETDNTQR
jgi:diaminopropionate ammonia-lyase